MLDLIKNYMEDMVKKYPPKENQPEVDLTVYYQNGNDGTDFDWDCNNRTCEFFLFYKSEKQLGYMKVYATKKGTLEGYVWDTERYTNGVELPSLQIGIDKCRKIKKYLFEERDNLSVWDKPIFTLSEGII